MTHTEFGENKTELCEAMLKKNVCLQLPTQVFKEWVGRSGFFFFFFFCGRLVGLYKVTSPTLKSK